MKLDKRIEVRVDARTKEIISELASPAGLSVSSYVRMLLLRFLSEGGYE